MWQGLLCRSNIDSKLPPSGRVWGSVLLCAWLLEWFLIIVLVSLTPSATLAWSHTMVKHMLQYVFTQSWLNYDLMKKQVLGCFDVWYGRSDYAFLLVHLRQKDFRHAFAYFVAHSLHNPIPQRPTIYTMKPSNNVMCVWPGGLQKTSIQLYFFYQILILDRWPSPGVNVS